jgi:hypothetical protein
LGRRNVFLRAYGDREVLAEFYVEQNSGDDREQHECHEYFEHPASASAFPASQHIPIVAPEYALRRRKVLSLLLDEYMAFIPRGAALVSSNRAQIRDAQERRK